MIGLTNRRIIASKQISNLLSSHSYSNSQAHKLKIEYDFGWKIMCILFCVVKITCVNVVLFFNFAVFVPMNIGISL